MENSENSENSKSKDSLSKQILDALKDDSDESAEKPITFWNLF